MPLQLPQLDDRTFEQLFVETRARIPVHTPEWTNFNESDPGITLVRLFAYMTENLLYRSNRIPELNRRKFLSLLGVGLQPALPGRGLVVFRNDRGPMRAFPIDAGAELQAGKTPFRSRTGVCILPVSAAVFYKRPQTDLDTATVEQYRLLYETLLERDSDQLQFYKMTPLEAPEIGKPLPTVDLADTVQGTIDRSLWVALVAPPNVPLDTARAALAGQTLAIGVYPSPEVASRRLPPATAEVRQVADPGLVFEIAAPDPGYTDTLAPPNYVRLNVEYAENVLETAGIVQVTLPAYEQLRLWKFDPIEEGTLDYPPLIEDKELASRIVTWVRIRLPKPEGDAEASAQQARLSWVGINAARVIQALPVVNERLGVGNGAPEQIYRVANTPVIVAADPAAGETAGQFVLEVQTEDGAWERWCRIDDLTAAGPQDKAFQLDPEAGIVRFGSGLRGLRPPLGRAIRASYEYGGGPEGRVSIGAINKSAALPGGFKVENPLATWGASQGETVADGERNIARSLRHRDRLVTASDVRDIAWRTPGVDMGRVEVLPLFNPHRFDPNAPPATWPGTVTVLVIPRFDPVQPAAPVPDRLFLEAVCNWLDPRRLVTTELYACGPQYIPLWVTVGITTMAGQVRALVQRAVEQALRDYLSPLYGGPQRSDPSVEDPCAALNSDADPSGARGTGWPLGMEVRRQDLEAVATRVPGVRYVDSVRMAVRPPGGATLTDVERVAIAGRQLPHLVGISVREGAAEPLEAILGSQPVDDVNQAPVPVLPKKC